MVQKLDSITSLMFPNVVFSSFIIITSVIVMSYVLGHAMSPVLVRIFNAIGMILYLVATCIAGQAWYQLDDNQLDRNGNMLVAQIILSFLNTILYGYDMFCSVRQEIKKAEVV